MLGMSELAATHVLKLRVGEHGPVGLRGAGEGFDRVAPSECSSCAGEGLVAVTSLLVCDSP